MFVNNLSITYNRINTLAIKLSKIIYNNLNMFDPGEFVTLDNYDILSKEMRSFDLLMFRGDDIVSNTIAEVQKHDQFTHAGLVIHPELLPGYNLNPNRLYVFESTYTYEVPGIETGPPDHIKNRRFFGVHLRDLETVCRSYIRNDKTKIAWYPLRFSINNIDFTSIFTNYHMRPFLDQSILPMIDFTHITPDLIKIAESIINAPLLEAVLRSSFSCVNLVMAVYKDIGLITKSSTILYPIQLLTLE